MKTIVLVLPGGKVRSDSSSRPWHLSSVRMRPFTRVLSALAESATTAGEADIHVVQVRYRKRGWNGNGAEAIADARGAMQRAIELNDSEIDTNVIVVGHSMGGRVAAHLASDPRVSGVIALAPWWPDEEGNLFRAGQRLAVLHGTEDRWTDPVLSRAEVLRASRNGVEAHWEPMEDAGHFMLSKTGQWHNWVVESAERMIAASHTDNPSDNT
ncbi:alpha/beta hydrolase [Hoyosella rhizosphaerae]|uniref:alpha/beta hydrolase n=1 Tax=Hoyosella rhizosphaerae TaxID=1755582 RepID=UPI001E3900A2|nr:alpha/beta fold hydrolase [Hoyosella rhizosphaerae]